MRWLLLLFIVVPLIELYLLRFVGSKIGFWPTVGIVLFAGMLGVSLAKREGLRVWQTYNEALAQGRLPDEGIVNGLLVLLGGALLVFPGMLTDVLGFGLLIPQLRNAVADRIRAVIAKKMDSGVLQVFGAIPGDGFVDMHGVGHGPGPKLDPFDGIFERRGGYDRVDVVDTEGVEVQEGLLLGPAQSEPLEEEEKKTEPS